MYSNNLLTSGKTHYDPFGMLLEGRNKALSSENYRFGFNGQEQDDEVNGNGNINTAKYWEYDSRLGRRWNVDPVYKPYSSNYCILSNNPVLKIDPKGADDYFSNTGEFLGSDGKSTNQIRIIDKSIWASNVVIDGKSQYNIIVSDETIIDKINKNSRLITQVQFVTYENGKGTPESNSAFDAIASYYYNGKNNTPYVVKKDEGEYAYYDPNERHVVFDLDDYGRLNPLLSDINSFWSVLRHENVHYDHNQSLSNASVGSILTHLDVYKIELNTDRFWLADELYIDNIFNVISQYLEKAQNLLDSDILNWYDENDQNKLNEYKKYFNDIKTSNNENK